MKTLFSVVLFHIIALTFQFCRASLDLFLPEEEVFKLFGKLSSVW